LGRIPGNSITLSFIAPETFNILPGIENVRSPVNQILKNPVRKIRTPGSVGDQATNWVAILPGAGSQIMGSLLLDLNLHAGIWQRQVEQNTKY